MSAYRDKYVEVCHSKQDCLVEHFNVPLNPNLASSKATLKDVLMALLLVPLHQVNAHFKPMHALCELGQIQYDFVGDLDTPSDLEYIASRIGASDLFREYSSKTGLAEQYPAFECDTETVDLARALYGRDAALLGYSFDKAYDSCGKYGKSSM